MQVLKVILSRVLPWSFLRPRNGLTLSDDPPLRGKLFNIEQLERHAVTLASTHQLATQSGSDKLLLRLAENERLLIDAYDVVTAAAAQDRQIEPGGEWLLDNFYLIEEQIREIRRLLPPAYSRELPRLANTAAVGCPRVYGIALEFIAHVDGRVDLEGLNSFMTAYQSVNSLKLGELWAIPLMFRLALIENLRRVAVRISAARRDRDRASGWADRMVHIVEQNPTDIILVLADMARADPPLSGPFLSELTRALHGQNPNFAFANSWIEHRLADQGLTAEELVRAEGQTQAADQVSFGNSVGSLRFLGSTNWRQFVAEQSLVEKTLIADPASLYLRMDFATRDRYRHAVEAIARRSKFSEYEVACKAVQLAADAACHNAADRSSHVGYYLIDRGRPVLERSVQMRLTPAVFLDRIRRKFPLWCYLFVIVLTTLLASSLFLSWTNSFDIEWMPVWVLFVPVVICASKLGVGIANWLATNLLRPGALPRMDFEQGIPVEHRTLVAVPTMLTSVDAVEQLIEGIELRYLGNRDPCLHFALLTDFIDSPSETTAGDEELVRSVQAGINRLNAKYAELNQDIFFLFHRSRSWNAQEGVWMGHERKRGKLCDLNATLRGARDRFSVVVGEADVLRDVRYVISLDTDTQLPRDAAWQMVGTMAHLLNRPNLSDDGSHIEDGYAILQPRVDVTLASSQRSRFSQLYSDSVGVDPYTRVVSDVYQDLFGEGSFIGKGIYDVDTFMRCCCSFPENRILSHDLIEGAYSRSGLLSDVTLYEEFPSRYAADIARRHRWIRGDWQIAAWLLPWVRGSQDAFGRNPISALSQWKIFDNLRRSLVPIAMVMLLLVAWGLSATVALGASLFLLCVVFLPTLLVALSDGIRKPVDLPWKLHLHAILSSLRRPLAQGMLTLAFLPYEACLSIDAILRTFVRLAWTKRKLLEWKTASDSNRLQTSSLLGTFRLMIVGPVVAGFSMIVLWAFHVETLLFSVPWIAVWMFSPVIAWWISRPILTAKSQLSDDQLTFLRKVSRMTWRYFEEFVNETENWLPPDNIHMNPNVVVASRTSPTNIGMALLADLAAVDFGYCSVARFLQRTQGTFSSLSRMERYRGHFYNWYDTRTLLPMHPHYVSTVDSGNLAGNLLVLRRGLIEFSHSTVLPQRIFEGLSDTLQVQLETARKTPQVDQDVIRKLELLDNSLPQQPGTLFAANRLLEQLVGIVHEIANVNWANAEFAWWSTAFERNCREHLNDLRHLAVWVTLTPPPEELLSNLGENHELLKPLQSMLSHLNSNVCLQEIAQFHLEVIPFVNQMLDRTSSTSKEWLFQLHQALVESSANAAARIQTLEQVAGICEELSDMDFGLLYCPKRDLFTVGYNATELRHDASYYDLLASEARLASYVVIAQGNFGQQHWFALGRLLTNTGSSPALLSWSGSMFEYLMPLLIMPNYANTLLDRTYRAIVGRQIEYGRQRNVPWGISESGYNTVDLHRIYQYRAFGVPGLGLKRGLDEDLVVAPYASALALMVSPEAACLNLERLASIGQQGPYGFYEAVDYTPSRIPPGTTRVTVKQFMSHHEGMSLLAFAFVLLNQPMQRRFLSDPMLRAASLLLQERVPKTSAPVFPHANEANARRLTASEETEVMRVIKNPNRQTIDTQLLANDRYHVVVTSAGGGYSRWGELTVTRWREDATRDCYGSFCFLRDVESGNVWSNTWQPTTNPGERYEAIFSQSRAEFRRSDEQIETYTQISVSPEDDMELRRVTLTNRSERTRTLEITSYSEVVLATQAQDEAHPAFSNLFVQTEIVSSRNAIYCTRRPRSDEERPPWLTHMMSVRGETALEASYETDRMRFIGRHHTLASPIALTQQGPLSNTEGPVLDPIVSIRQTVVLRPNEEMTIDLVTGVSESRTGIEAMTEKYQDVSLAHRVFDLAWTHSQILLQQLSISEADAQIYCRLAGALVYGSALHRAKPSVLGRNQRGQSGLWGYGISGDLPIVLVRIRDRANIDLVRQAIQAHAYWRSKGLIVDLVIWNEDDSVYRQTLQETISDLVSAGPDVSIIDRPGGVFIRRGEQMSDEDRTLLLTVARIVLLDAGGTLAEQADRRLRTEVFIPSLKPVSKRMNKQPAPETPYYDLALFNGLGGFSQDGREYVTILQPGKTTPAPWVNVIANEQFGSVVSESGSAYTWAENSHEYRLTPWHNDPVSDTTGEAIYVRDEETGTFWSPTPLPARGKNTYIVRHGFGYSIFDYTEDGITTELCVYVSTDAPVKFYKLKVKNHSGRRRQLSVTGYWELVLGDTRRKSQLHVVTETDPASGAILARNVYSPEFGDRVAFVNCSESTRTLTGDRTEFLGRNGVFAQPASMTRVRLSGRVGAGYDPCAAYQAPLALNDGEERTLTFTLGAAQSRAEAKALALRFRSVDDANRAIEDVWDFWARTLGVVYVETPDAAVNFLANGWLVYQTLACRMWARSGFYQSGGAFGFRDQLQDAMALVYSQPHLLRKHLLLAASRQFIEGDVQHWWHPPAGRGVRTKFSDDLLWLPLATCRYVNMTRDHGVLEERIPFLTARELHEDEESNYDLPQVSEAEGTLYEHGIRAIDHALKFGVHGLPLMGCGDWNDGMNLVGQDGKGESVWLAFFLFQVLERFSDLARQHDDAALADRYTLEAGRLRGNIEAHGWDGEWYRRAYFDDGTPLGSALNEECQIDAISQSWSILSGAGSVAHRKEALASLQRRLVRTEDRLILLLDPPFDKSDLNPGYIKGYVPGVRENGGQYTHSAIWAVMATAAAGDRQRAWELFDMINPISHGDSPEDIAKYRVEPYVVAADVYGVAPHTGRGGWTWYTGSSGWMYRLIVESLIGLHVAGDKLTFTPCLPDGWTDFKLHYRFHETFYHISIMNSGINSCRCRMTLDKTEITDGYVTMHDDRVDHEIVVELQ